MKVFSIDLRLYATAYIKAETAEEALAIAKGLADTSLDLTPDEYAEPPISGRRFEDADLPDISLSPCMTIKGPEEDDIPDEHYDYDYSTES